ncbi:hypothetical protein hrd7_03450 [Leptolinea sp. HRD-7]|nr:hypothetical protein hrd7_03450 [Leptolinea sp. HRD-7]
MTYTRQSIAEPPRFSTGESGIKIRLLIALLLLVGFSLVFYSGGSALAETPAFSENDVLFQLDTQRTVNDITYYGGLHYRTKVHPIFVLMVNPVGELFQRITGDPELAATLLSSILGAAGITLFFLLASTFLTSLSTAFLLAVFFGVTASQSLLSIIPGTSSLAVCSLMVTLLVFAYSLRRKTVPLIPWILAGVFSLGVTTTNVAQTGICFLLASLAARGESPRFQWSNVVIFIAAVLGITAALSLIQKWIYPTSVLFFLPEAYSEDVHYASLLIFQIPGDILRQLFQNIFAVNIFAPVPVAFEMEGRSLQALSFASASQYTVFGLAGLILWFSLWLTGLAGFIRGTITKHARLVLEHRFFLTGLSVCLLFNLVFHSFYGVDPNGTIEYFLYSGNFTLLVIGMFTVLSGLPRRSMNAFLVALIICAAANNAEVLRQIIALYAGQM